ncbi:MAG: hypothetical protein M9894_16135 [Planctomycetes bacterium]|nr:hypothetical protein [Planctomycetota bacterium]
MTMQSISSTQIRPDLGMPYAELDPVAQLMGFIFPVLFPLLDQQLNAGSYAKIKGAALMPKVSLDDLRRGQTGNYKRDFWEYESDKFETQDYGKEELVDRRAAGVAGIHGLRLYQVATDRATSILLRAIEQSAADELADAAKYAAQYTAGSNWAVPGGTPITDVKALIERYEDRVGESPGALHIPIKAARNALLTTQVQTVIGYRPSEGLRNEAMLGNLMEATLTQVFGIRVVISGWPAGGFRNTADPGLQAALARIHDQTKVQALAVNPGDLQSGRAFARRFVWSGEGGSAGGLVVEQYEEPGRRSDVICARSDFELKIVDGRCLEGLHSLAGGGP